MKQAVDKEKQQIFIESFIKLRRLFLYGGDIKNQFAGSLGQGKREYVGRLIFAAILLIKTTNRRLRDKGDG